MNENSENNNQLTHTPAIELWCIKNQTSDASVEVAEYPESADIELENGLLEIINRKVDMYSGILGIMMDSLFDWYDEKYARNVVILKENQISFDIFKKACLAELRHSEKNVLNYIIKRYYCKGMIHHNLDKFINTPECSAIADDIICVVEYSDDYDDFGRKMRIESDYSGDIATRLQVAYAEFIIREGSNTLTAVLHTMLSAIYYSLDENRNRKDVVECIRANNVLRNILNRIEISNIPELNSNQVERLEQFKYLYDSDSDAEGKISVASYNGRPLADFY